MYFGYVRAFRSVIYHCANELTAVFYQIPHEKRIRAVIGIAEPIHLYVAGIVGEFPFVLIPQIESVARFRQQPIEEFDVARMEIMIELVITRMVNDQNPALLQ